MNAYITTSSLKKIEMWYKVKELYEDKVSKSQISRDLGIHRDTVRKYLSMSEDEFLHSNSCKRHYHYKLEPYEDFIYRRLESRPYLSSSQIYDKLKENYPNLPKVDTKTVYNYVCFIRSKYKIPKSLEKGIRPYEMQPEDPYGVYAQVDFGERYMRTANGASVKVYFFAMVLSRSRHKFIYFSERPFTTASSIYAHQLAFQFYGGIPQKIIYDQDKVFIHRENLGDYILTHAFRSFVREHKFETIFCRKSDPESKGKIENVVKYVKRNFLSGRDYDNIDTLNKEVLAWLTRTGNGEVHASTRKIPAQEFEVEKDFLSPYTGIPSMPENKLLEYHVRKDNTINYHANYYTVPTGTYQGRDTCVYIEVIDDKLNIYSKDTGKTIATHTLCSHKGNLIRNASHQRSRGVPYSEIEDPIKEFFDDSPTINHYLRELYNNKRRYYRDSLDVLNKNLSKYPKETLSEALMFCSKEGIYNTNTMIEITQSLAKSKGIIEPSPDLGNMDTPIQKYNIQPEKTDMNTYNNIFQ